MRELKHPLFSGLGIHTIPEQEYENLKYTADFPFVRKGNWLCISYKKEEKYYLEVFASYMWVKQKLIDMDSGEVKLKLSFFNGAEMVEKVFAGTILDKNGIKDLLCFGIRFEDKNVPHVIRYLIKSEEKAPIHCTYTRLGWGKDREEPIFKSGYTIGKAGIISGFSFDGNPDLMPKGNLQSWENMVKEEVLWNMALVFILILGFASPVLAYLNHFQDIGTIMFNLSNRSSKGKTTAAMLAASVFSNPIINQGSMITYHGTENALVQFISDFQGHTVVLDEVAMSGSSDFTKFMYTICNGRSKMRLNGDSTQKEIREFSSVIISTAEFDLIDDNSPDGVRARVFELKDSLTRDAENSDAIKHCVIQNFGVAGRKFLQFLMQRLEKLPSDYEQDKKQLIQLRSLKKGLTDRILSKLAVLFTTARYVEKIFGFGINLNDFLKYLLLIEKSIQQESNSPENLIEIIKQEVSTHFASYQIDNGITPNNYRGIIRTDGPFSEIIISESEFKRIIHANGINRYRDYLKILKAKGILQTESDRLYKRMVLIPEVGRENCYCFRVENEKKIISPSEKGQNSIFTEAKSDNSSILDSFKEM